MTITISKLTVANNAPAGTVIGELTTYDASGKPIPCAYTLTKASVGYFAISGNALMTAWTSPMNPVTIPYGFTQPESLPRSAAPPRLQSTS